MLNIGERITQLRKQQGLSQSELAKKIEVSRIEILLKIAKIFNVSIDFSIGDGQLSIFDKDVVKRIEGIELLVSDTRKHLFFLMDNAIQNFKTQKAFA